MFWFDATHPDTGEPLEVEAVRYRSRRGLRDCYGAPMEPDDEEELTICRVRDQFGREMAFPDLEAFLLEQGRRVVQDS